MLLLHKREIQFFINVLGISLKGKRWVRWRFMFHRFGTYVECAAVAQSPLLESHCYKRTNCVSEWNYQGVTLLKRKTFQLLTSCLVGLETDEGHMVTFSRNSRVGLMSALSWSAVSGDVRVRVRCQQRVERWHAGTLCNTTWKHTRTQKVVDSILWVPFACV